MIIHKNGEKLKKDKLSFTCPFCKCEFSPGFADDENSFNFYQVTSFCAGIDEESCFVSDTNNFMAQVKCPECGCRFSKEFEEVEE